MPDGLAIQLTTDPTDLTGFPVVPDIDPIVKAGTLLYAEPGAPGWPWMGVPAPGATVPNQAWSELAALVGSGDESTLALTVAQSAVAPNLVQRTAKGGLHVGHKKGTGSATDARYYGVGSTPMRDFIASHLTHSYYIGLITVITDDATSVPSYTSRVAGYIVNSTTAVAAIALTTGVLTAYPTANRSSVQTLARTEGAPGLVDAAWTSISGIPNSDLAWVGHNGGAGSPNASTVLYALLVEDLTVSGRSYNTVHAAMQQKATDWFAIGGRYAGDTYTDPGTLA